MASCASTGPAERSYARIQEAEKLWGPAANWTPRQNEVFNGLEHVARAQGAERSAQAAALGAAIGQGIQQGAAVYQQSVAAGNAAAAQYLQQANQARALNAGNGTPVTAPGPSLGALHVNRYDPNSLANPYGAGSPYKPDGLMNPYSQYGSSYSNKSWRNPYATDAPKLYDQKGNYRGKLSTNSYDRDSTSNPYGRYGSKYSPDSINNPYGAGNPYSSQPINVVPSR